MRKIRKSNLGKIISPAQLQFQYRRYGLNTFEAYISNQFKMQAIIPFLSSELYHTTSYKLFIHKKTREVLSFKKVEISKTSKNYIFFLSFSIMTSFHHFNFKKDKKKSSTFVLCKKIHKKKSLSSKSGDYE